MSMDGTSQPCPSLPLGSCPSPARKIYSPSLPLTGIQNLTISAFHQTLILPCKPRFCTHSHHTSNLHAAVSDLPRFCTHSHDISNLHAAVLHLSIHPHARGTSLGLSVRLQNDFSKPTSGKKYKQRLTRGDSHQEQGFLNLESEILEFMENSDRPELFPSRSELTRAGRSDLVEGILAKGGWMVAGWDTDSIMKEQVQHMDNLGIDRFAKESGEDYAEVCIGEFLNRQPASLGSNAVRFDVADLTTNFRREARGVIAVKISQSARAVPTLERQRGWEKVAGLFGLSSMAKPEHGEKPLALATQEIQQKPPNVNGTYQSAAQVQDAPEGSSRDKPLWLLAGGSQHPEMMLGVQEGKRKRRRKFPRNGSAGFTVHQTVDPTNKHVYRDTRSKTSHSKSGERKQDGKSMVPVSHRIRGLEAELVSTLDVLKSERHAFADDIKSKQKHGVALTKLEEISDALEFCETEIMNKRRELRTARAQRTAFEGKLALELMDFKKILEEKDKQLEQATQALKMLRTARIVWPHPAVEVFLAGSFDGWTSWRRMEKSSAGVFVTALHLYPGQYEIKFIVNGEWRVDPNRPISRASGFQNNVLTIV